MLLGTYRGDEYIIKHDNTFLYKTIAIDLIIFSSIKLKEYSKNNTSLLFYGNIYNIDFENKVSDCLNETITLECFFNQLKGEFISIIIKNKQLILVRDNFGFVPLYYYIKNNSILFSTHLSLIRKNLTFKPKINLKQFLLASQKGLFINDYESAFEEIFLVPHSTILTFEENKINKLKYWDINIKHEENIKKEYAYINFKNLLFNSVKSRTINEKTVCAELSGGLDSSTVVCIASKSTKVKAYSQVLEENSVGKIFPFNDELRYSKLIVEQNQNINHILIDNKNIGLLDILLSSVKELGYINSALYSDFTIEIVNNAKQYNTGTILSGFGGDQVVSNIGTSYFKERVKKFKFKDFNKYLTLITDRIKKSKIKIITSLLYDIWLKGFFKSNKAKIKIENVFNKNFKKELKNIKIDSFKTAGFKSSSESLYNALFNSYTFDRINSCAEIALKKNIFYKYPLLDKDLLEFYFSIPSNVKYNSYQTRFLFRNTIKGVVPEEIINRKSKSGSTVPSVQTLFLRDYNNIENFIIKCKTDLKTRIHNFDEILLWHKTLKNRVSNSTKIRMTDFIIVLKQLIFLYLYENDEL